MKDIILPPNTDELDALFPPCDHRIDFTSNPVSVDWVRTADAIAAITVLTCGCRGVASVPLSRLTDIRDIPTILGYGPELCAKSFMNAARNRDHHALDVLKCEVILMQSGSTVGKSWFTALKEATQFLLDKETKS